MCDERIKTAPIAQGTTPTFTFVMPSSLNFDDIENICIAFAQRNRVITEKHLPDIVKAGAHMFEVTLSQEDTLDFRANETVNFQVRLLFGETAIASYIYTAQVKEALCDEVLGTEIYNNQTLMRIVASAPQNSYSAKETEYVKLFKYNNRIIDLGFITGSGISDFDPKGTYPDLKAGYAEKDGNGNVIHDTYSTREELSEVQSEIPKKTSEIINDSGYITSEDIPVTSVNNKTGDVTITKNDVGLGNADNTSDINKPVSILQQAAINEIEAKIPKNTSQLINDSGFITANEAPVLSVNGKTGVITLSASDIGLGNVFDLKGSVATVEDLPMTGNKIGDIYYVIAESVGYVWLTDTTIGTERWEQLGLSIDLSNYVTKPEFNAHVNDKSNPHEVTKAQIGLGNVDNTADMDKPLSIPQQQALDAVAATIPTKTSELENDADFVTDDEMQTALQNKEDKHSYKSLTRLGTYLYNVTFNEIPEYIETNSFLNGMCSSFVKDGKLYRNLDLNYNNTATFYVQCNGFYGVAVSNSLTNTSLNDEAIGQLPYHLTDGRNDSGIMVSEHVLYNDWNWQGSGNIPLDTLPYFILSTIKTLDNFEIQMFPIISNLKLNSALSEAGYLLQYLVTDGTTTYAILPPMSSSGEYVVVDITSNPKLTNFRWLNKATVELSDNDLQTRPTGIERWNMIPSATLEDLRFTLAYEAPDRLSEFIGIDGTTKYSTIEELTEIYNEAHGIYEDRSRDGRTWQTMHSVIYSDKGIEAFYVQEDFQNNYSWKSELENKVDKEQGKGLSANDFTTALRGKLSGIEPGAEVNVLEGVKVNGSDLPITNKKVNVDLSNYVKNTDYATAQTAGVAMVNPAYGIVIRYGTLEINDASYAQIDDREAYKPITPINLDYAVRSVRPDVKYTNPATLSVNTIYTLGVQSSALTVKLPTGQIGDFIQVDFITGATPPTFSIDATSAALNSDYDISPEANKIYSIYFDWGVLGYDSTEDEYLYGWRVGYADYAFAQS